MGHWDCPRCRDACPCKRCRNRVNSSPEPKKRKLESQVISGLGLTNATAHRSAEEPATCPKPQSNPTSWVQELHNKNEKCLSYIDRTERLLQLVREEQSRIASELDALIPRPQRDSAEATRPI